MSTSVAEQTCIQCGKTAANAAASGVESCHPRPEASTGLTVILQSHRWEPWSDEELAVWGIRPAFFGLFRTSPMHAAKRYPCEVSRFGHVQARHKDQLGGLITEVGQCLNCAMTDRDIAAEQESTRKVLSTILCESGGEETVHLIKLTNDGFGDILCGHDRFERGADGVVHGSYSIGIKRSETATVCYSCRSKGQDRPIEGAGYNLFF